jgi:hypothetical protein
MCLIEFRYIVGNARSNMSMGHLTSAQFADFWLKLKNEPAISKANRFDALKSKNKIFGEAISYLRFDRSDPSSGRFLINDMIVPMPVHSRDGRSSITQNIKHITTVQNLFRMMSKADKEKIRASGYDLGEVILKPHPDELAIFAAQIASLPDELKFFSLCEDKLLGGTSLLWFTTEDSWNEAERARVSAYGPYLTEADWFLTWLGLGHYKKGEWLVALDIPAKAISPLGHFRPTFCEGATGEWFMSKSSTSSSSSDWGQTADLRKNSSNDRNIDGAFERVAPPPSPSELIDNNGNQLRIGFRTLGKVEFEWGTPAARVSLTKRIWNRR